MKNHQKTRCGVQGAQDPTFGTWDREQGRALRPGNRQGQMWLGEQSFQPQPTGRGFKIAVFAGCPSCRS